MQTFKQYMPNGRIHSGLVLYQSGWEKCPPDHAFGPCVREYFLFHYLLSGAGEFEIGGKVYSLSAHQGFLIPPGEVTFYHADSANPYEYYWVGFHGTDAAALLKMTGLLDNGNYLYTKDNAESMIPLLARICNGSKNGVKGDYALLGYLFLLLSEMMDTVSTPENTECTSEGYLEQAFRYVDINYCYEITVEKLADFLGLHRSRVFRIFKSALSVSPQQYILHYRLDKAAFLLGTQKLNVNQVAYQCGFNDASYFSRAFKAKFGIAPMDAKRDPIVTG